MLSIYTIKSAKDAAHYYERDDYHSKDDPDNKYSEWYGKGAKELGLSGEMEKEQFIAMLEGKLPNGIRLGRREGDKINHAPGVDLTFSSPKSVSILSEILGDKKVKEAHEKAVKSTLDYIEKEGLVKIRNKVNGEITREKADNITCTIFRHHTSRAGDPQLHYHIVFLNAAQKENGDWRSADFKELYEHKMMLGQRFRLDLAYELQKLGYTIRRTGRGMFEVAGIPQHVIDNFSKRSKTINEALKEYDFVNAKTKALVTKVTRESKKSMTQEEFLKWWYEQCYSKEVNFEPTTQDVKKAGHLHQQQGLEGQKRSGGDYQYFQERWEEFCSIFESNNKEVEHVDDSKNENIPIAEKAVSNAIRHLTERSSVFTKKDLLKFSYEASFGCQLVPSEIEKEKERLLANGTLLPYTSKIAAAVAELAEESTNQNWGKTLKTASKKWGKATCDSWIAKLEFKEEKNNIVYLQAPSGFIKEEVEKLYSRGLFKMASKHFKGLKKIKILSPNEKTKNSLAQQKNEKIIEKAMDKEFSKWRRKLTPQQKNQINPYHTKLNRKLNTGVLKSHFKNEILVPKLSKQGKLKQIKATENKSFIPQGKEIDRDAIFEETYTTKEALREEQETIKLLKSGFNTQKSIYTKAELKAHLKNTTLNKGQKAAVSLILGTRDRTVGVQGHAGTGKTYMLKEVRHLLEKKGYEAIGLASSSSAASTLQRDTGIKSQTAHKFLFKYKGLIEGRGTKEGRIEMQQALNKKVLIFDEASLAPTVQINRLQKLSEMLNVRTTYAGDSKQLGAVEAGKPFIQKQKAGMQTAIMDDIKRQTNKSLKDAVYNTIEAVDRQDSRYIRRAIAKIGNNLHEVATPIKGKVFQTMVQKGARMWLACDKKVRAETLIITPSHDIRNAVNDVIVDQLRTEGTLTGMQEEVSTLRSKNLTEAEKERADKYEVGDQVLFYKSYKSLGTKRGQYYAVTKTNGYNKVQLSGLDDPRVSCWFDPEKLVGNRKGAIEVFSPEPEKLGLQKGALIRWTKNSGKHTDIKNSETAEILDITDKHIQVKLSSGITKSIAKDDHVFKHVTFAYCSTVHAAQGKTMKYTIGIIESDHRYLTNQRLFYVELSRAKEKVFLITDNVEKLFNTLSKVTGAKLSALEHQGELSTDKGGNSLTYLQNNTALNPKWNRAMQDVVKQFGETTYLSWFSRIDFDSKKDGVLNLKTDSQFVKDTIEKNYSKKFSTIVEKHFKGTKEINVSLSKESTGTDISNNILKDTNIQKEPENKVELTI